MELMLMTGIVYSQPTQNTWFTVNQHNIEGTEIEEIERESFSSCINLMFQNWFSLQESKYSTVVGFHCSI